LQFRRKRVESQLTNPGEPWGTEIEDDRDVNVHPSPQLHRLHGLGTARKFNMTMRPLSKSLCFGNEALWADRSQEGRPLG
jgi:hypothetical protein